MLAITVVLAGVMYVTVQLLIPPSSESPFLGARVVKSGLNWSVEIITASPNLDINFVFLSVSNPNGTINMRATPMSQVTGFHDVPTIGTLNAGDFILLPIATYPLHSHFLIISENNILFSGELRS